MKKVVMLWLSLTLGCLFSVQTLGQTTVSDEKMSVTDRLAKARAAKADKRVDRVTQKPYMNGGRMGTNGAGTASRYEKAFPNDYKAPVDKVQKGPNGEVVRIGERGAKYYINKNGNKTYLSSNH